jgi:chorismate mutase/prephenate dehydrogenase
MGRWFERFLSAQGYATRVLDSASDPEEAERGRAALRTADFVLCATPPGACAALYREWRQAPPAGVIADIASVKTPLIEPIRALQRAGARVGSLHPMFGPSIVLLREADVVVCETGDAEATAAVEDLFRPTTVRLVRLPLDRHDRIMADLLSLAHASAIAFAAALPEEAHPVRSTTFQELESLAGAVVRESPEVYYEIQAGNPESPAAVSRLRAALDRILDAVERRDFEAFQSLMLLGRRRTQEA